MEDKSEDNIFLEFNRLSNPNYFRLWYRAVVVCYLLGLLFLFCGKTRYLQIVANEPRGLMPWYPILIS